MPYCATLARHALIAFADQVEPAPEIGAKGAAPAGWAARIPAHRAVSVAAATATSRVRMPRAVLMNPAAGGPAARPGRRPAGLPCPRRRKPREKNTALA